MSELEEKCSGLEVLEQTVKEVMLRGIQKPSVNNNASSHGKQAESDFLHCVPPDPHQPPPLWKGSFRQQLQGKLSKNERNAKR